MKIFCSSCCFKQLCHCELLFSTVLWQIIHKERSDESVIWNHDTIEKLQFTDYTRRVWFLKDNPRQFLLSVWLKWCSRWISAQYVVLKEKMHPNIHSIKKYDTVLDWNCLLFVNLLIVHQKVTWDPGWPKYTTKKKKTKTNARCFRKQHCQCKCIVNFLWTQANSKATSQQMPDREMPHVMSCPWKADQRFCWGWSGFCSKYIQVLIEVANEWEYCAEYGGPHATAQTIRNSSDKYNSTPPNDEYKHGLAISTAWLGYGVPLATSSWVYALQL